MVSYTYDLAGGLKSASATPATPFGFTGQRFDAESGLYYYRARMYSPAWGRFLQADPIGYEGGLNLYAYVGNDPVNANDPEGLLAEAISSFVDVFYRALFEKPVNDLGQLYDRLLDRPWETISSVANSFPATRLEGGIASLAAGVFGARVVSALPAPVQLEASWGALNTYRGGASMTAIEHINYRHAFESGAVSVSRFAEGTSVKNIQTYVDQAIRYGTVTREGATTMVEHNLGRIIGTNVNGGAADAIRVFIRDGRIQTAFPISMP